MYWNIHYGIKNIFKWIPIIWFDRWCDWSFLARVMEFKLLEMARNFKERGHHVGSDKDARKMLICATLLRRMRDDEYIFLHKDTSKADRIAQYDQEYCFKLMAKHFRCWWN